MWPSSLGGAAYCVALCLSVCLSVCPSVPLLLPSVTSRHLANYNDTHVLFGEGRISYGHLGRTNSCYPSKDHFYSLFHSVLWHCWLGDMTGIQPVKSWVLTCWCWQFDWNFACLTAPVTSLLVPIKFRMETIRYRITQVHLENGC